MTGGAGFIGSHIVDELLRRGYNVTVIDNLSTGNKMNIHPSAELKVLNITDASISRVFARKKFDLVFHLAAHISVKESLENPIPDAQDNILGSLNILQNCVRYGVKKCIFSSTGGAIYGDTDEIPTKETHPEQPVSPYGIAKLSVEHYLRYFSQVHGLHTIILRYANVYGPRQNGMGEGGVVAIFSERILRGQDCVIYGDGKQTRDFVFVKDVVDANMKALAKGRSGSVYNIATGKETSVLDIFTALKNAYPFPAQKKRGPAVKGEQRRSCLSAAKAKKELGWRPAVSLDDGIKITAEWFGLRTKN